VKPYTPEQVRIGVARHLAGLGIVDYRPPGEAYPDTLVVPAVFEAVMPESPDLAVAVSVYDWSTARDKHNPDVFVQLRFRGAPYDLASVDGPADQAFAVLDEAERYVMPGGVRVLQSIRKVTTPPAADANGRFERFESYRFTLNPSESSQP